MDLWSTEFWSALEAIGTITAATLALFFWLWAEHIKPYWEAPKLAVEYENAQPWLKLNWKIQDYRPESQTGFWAGWGDTVRIRVHNKGKKTARQVATRIMAVLDQTGKPIADFEPTTLCWTNTRSTEHHPLLSPSDYEYVDCVFFYAIDQRLHWRIPADEPPRYPRFLPAGTSYVRVSVNAENAAPRCVTFQVTIGDETDSPKPDGRSETFRWFSMERVKAAPCRRFSIERRKTGL